MKEKLYNILKRFHRLVFPGIGVLYLLLERFFLGIAIITTVLGVLVFVMFISGLTLEIGSKKYEKNGQGRFGQIVITKREDGKKIFSLEIDEDPTKMKPDDVVSFKVVDKSSEGYE